MSRQLDPNNEIDRLMEHIAALESERDWMKARDHRFQMLIDNISDQLETASVRLDRVEREFAGISFVIAYYDIPRQIERTLLCCSPAYQGVENDEIEVILIDNGSTQPPPEDLQEKFPHISKIIRVEGRPSPVEGLNRGIEEARFNTVAVMIDGAHLLSPGVVSNARDVVRLFDNPVINVPQYLLGSVAQSLSTGEQAFERETQTLKELGWPKDGYRLFDYATYPGENYEKSFFSAIESNCLISTKSVFEASGAFDLRFDEPGAGFANLELFSRLIHNLQNAYVILLGEGSFHQDHRGVTTQRSPEEREDIIRQYRVRFKEVTGSETVLNTRSPFVFGVTRHSAQRVPTISREYRIARTRILRQLANIYVARAQSGLTDKYTPQLAVGGSPDERLARIPIKPLGLRPKTADKNGVDQKALGYVKCLQKIHKRINPELYFEIGVDTGASLRLAKCDSIGVDPGYFISNAITASCRLFREESDAFFENRERCAKLFARGIDFAFIDGMHLAEYVLRDFINVEKWMNEDGVVVFDDVLPERLEVLERERRFNAWCGDVYKIVPLLRRHRPDLNIRVVEAFVGPYRKGLAVVTGLNPKSAILEEKLPALEKEILGDTYTVESIEQLEEMANISKISVLNDLPRRKRESQPASHSPSTCEPPAIGASESGVDPSPITPCPKLSLVVVAYDMARELPRTLLSLSAKMQRDVSPEDYEVIVVDNGSPEPVSIEAVKGEFANIRLLRLPPGRQSPCHAANAGVEAALGPLIGVLIDGARMASPGLVRAAIDGLALSPNAVVGAHGFHLGEDIQQVSVKNGYDQTTEDALLESVAWERDGYRLFDISTPSKSSGKGWFTLPSETNSLFMRKTFWASLEGYDERFQSPGGGLANLDIWKRACETPGATPIIMLCEGTFHQVHGGVTTNAEQSTRAAFDAEYARIRGAPYRRPDVEALFVGRPNPAALSKMGRLIKPAQE